ncbi:MAG TPA: ABC transporter permease subunit [Myxococcales bacterium]|jgi:ABC-type transport system involved in multi-copper enzyme maturation permease subunit
MTFPLLLALSWNTVRELVRSKLLYNVVIFAALLLGSSLFVAQLTVGEWHRIIIDQGLAAAELGGGLIAVIVGVNLVAGEIDRRTIFPTLAKPVTRGAFVAGRYLGLVLVLCANAVLMLGLLAILVRLAGESIDAVTVQAMFLILIELMLLAAIAVFFGSFSTPMLAGGFSLALFLIGHMVSDLRAFGERSKSSAAHGAAAFFYRLLPDLELLNLKTNAANRAPVSASYVATSAAYGLAYAAALLIASGIVFSKRDLK